MKSENDLAKRINGAIKMIKSDSYLAQSDRIRYATIIEAYLFALDYFANDSGTIYDVSIKKQKKFLWWKYEEVENFVDCMVRHGNIYLESILFFYNNPNA